MILLGVSRFVLIAAWGSIASGAPVLQANDALAYISGTVTDAQSGEPIPDVHVLIVGTHLGRATDASGRFFIGPLQQGSLAIEFSHVSYEQIRDTLQLQPGDTVTYNVQLIKRSIMLGEVEITATQQRPAYLWKGTGGRVFRREDIEGTGVQNLGNLIRLMTPGAFVMELGPDVFIDFYKSSRRNSRPTFRDYQQNNPLVILNGTRIGKSALALNFLIKPEEIDEIVILRGLEADMYGYEGRDGVILVETTPEPPPTELSFFEKLLYISAVVGASLLVSLLLF